MRRLQSDHSACRLHLAIKCKWKRQPNQILLTESQWNRWGHKPAILLSVVSLRLELELNKLDAMLMEPHRQSPKTKDLRTGICRRRKQTLLHQPRPAGIMDEAISTPEDEENIHHIKHVASQPNRCQQLVCGQWNTVQLKASINVVF